MPKVKVFRVYESYDSYDEKTLAVIGEGLSNWADLTDAELLK